MGFLKVDGPAHEAVSPRLQGCASCRFDMVHALFPYHQVQGMSR